jgi:phosphate acetyltransferase
MDKIKFPSNSFEEYMVSSLKDLKKRIVFVDGVDPRLAEAIKIFNKYNKSNTIILGDEKKIFSNLKNSGINDKDNIEVIDPKTSPMLENYQRMLIDIFKRENKPITESSSGELASMPNYFAALMLKSGDADCGISGSLSPTEAMMRPLIQVIGTGQPKRYLSGAVMQIVPDCPYGLEGKFIFSDVAVIPEPDERQLIDIVLESHKTATVLYDHEPRIAILSYSTRGSAKGERIDKIRRAISKIKEIEPSIKIDGELQFDAAVIPDVAKNKVRDSEIAGQANVLIFPNLDAANICIKAVNRLARTDYYGTIIQGSPVPFNDLSRGSPPAEIVKLTFLTLMQLKMKENS